MVKVKAHQACRHYDLILNKKEKDLHHKLIMKFIDEGYPLSPSGGSSGPNLDDNMRVIKGEYRMVFYLNEVVADIYEKEMGLTKRCETWREKSNRMER